MNPYTEDTLVQATTADYLRDELGWESVYAYNQENFGEDGLLGRLSDREVVLTRYLRNKLEDFNPGLPDDAYRDAIRQITEYSSSQTVLAINQEKYNLFKDGIQVSFRNNEGKLVKERLRVFDFDHPDNNHFLAVREFWIKGVLYRRRADIIGFVNGIPLLFMELKNVNKDIRAAYDGNLADYRDVVPTLFHHTAFLILANGIDARIGASPETRFEYFHEWKRLDEDQKGAVDMETLLMGVCHKHTFMDIFENFITFDSSSGNTVKIVARNHQYLGVNQAIESVKTREEREGKLGVFWHTQGSGKSYSMVFFTRKIHRKLGGNFTFLICTDRKDLDSQIYDTFAGCGLVDNDSDPCRASSNEDLKTLLGPHKSHIFTLIQKFTKDVDPNKPYNTRNDIIVITDEAHRTQYGRLSLNMRNALPQASYIGFTGTPLFTGDEVTRRIFGDYISTYDFQRAVDDRATVPLYYDARGDKLGITTNDINERIAQKLEQLEAEEADIKRLERELKRDYHIITADKRLDQVAKDFVTHYSTAWESGKAMLVCIDKLTCVKMHGLIFKYWQERIRELEAALAFAPDEQAEIYQRRQIEWMKATIAAVVVSEQQGEVDSFRQEGFDITSHRQLIKNGFELDDGKCIDIESAFKKQEHPFRIAIVCAMWLTGFDVPSLTNLYLDKPLKAHTLMQAIARANRVFEGKNNGLILDYCGILKNLRQALATFAGTTDTGNGREAGSQPVDPAKPQEELLADLAEAIGMARTFLSDRNFELDRIIESTSFARIAAISAAKEAVNENDEARKRFEIMCREALKQFKACINIDGINAYRKDRDALNIIYTSVINDREKADISDVIRQLRTVVNEAIDVQPDQSDTPDTLYDISHIDFDLLRREFERSATKNTTVQTLKQTIDKRLGKMMGENSTRTNYQQHYEEIIKAYNSEKDRVTIEATFDSLINFYQELDEEDNRHIREGLSKEELAIYDLLKKSDLSSADIKLIKAIAGQLLETLKAEKLRIENWKKKESTRDAVSQTIKDFLWSDDTGLPVDSYTEEEVEETAEEVYRHVFKVYPRLPSPFYADAA
ncbi:dead deah box helicase [Leptolyngbya sp. Heron Island J]|uniref:type I restriction endonuclease subunit R n=1 Tax=Leptolyngbya sp. Heron Island J TaxID=1385935 RepID=UPI0003B9E4E9|nr:type I restriction endonuclease subunit R [Leptolyngbya sp. Heron Island J]ESA35113.1 dead deah box helicase [Leptolyngbya sp. Heron Island J]